MLLKKPSIYLQYTISLKNINGPDCEHAKLLGRIKFIHSYYFVNQLRRSLRKERVHEICQLKRAALFRLIDQDGLERRYTYDRKGNRLSHMMEFPLLCKLMVLNYLQ